MLIGSLHGISKVVGMPPAVIKAGCKVAQKLSLVSLMCAYACKMLPDATKMGSSWIQLAI